METTHGRQMKRKCAKIRAKLFPAQRGIRAKRGPRKAGRHASLPVTNWIEGPPHRESKTSEAGTKIQNRDWYLRDGALLPTGLLRRGTGGGEEVVQILHGQRSVRRLVGRSERPHQFRTRGGVLGQGTGEVEVGPGSVRVGPVDSNVTVVIGGLQSPALRVDQP